MSLNTSGPRRSRSALALAAATALTLTLAGCGGSSGAGDSGTVTFLSWDAQETMQPLIDAFEKENPGLTVKASYAPPVTEYIQKLQTQLASNTAADVFIITAENKTQIMQGGFADDLSDAPWISNISQAARDTYSLDGKVYGAAVSSWGGGILVNKALLARVGANEAPETWADFLSIGEKLRDAGIPAFLEPSDGVPVTLSALLNVENTERDRAMDQQIWAGETSFADTWTPSLEAWYQLVQTGMESTAAAGLTTDQVLQEFEQGNVAMIGTGSWALGGIRAAAPDLDLAYFAVPTPSGEESWAGAVSPGYAVNAKAKNAEGAQKFVEFLQGSEGVSLYQKATQSITTTADVTPSVDPALDAMVPAVRDGDIYLPAVSWPDHADVMTSEAIALLQQTIAGKISPEQFARGLDDKLASIR